MKKFIFVIFICILTLTACKNNPNTNEVALPTHPNMEFVEIVHQAKEENEYTTTLYTVKNSTQEQVTEEYIKILENDSWNITFVNKPLLIEATKENKEIMIFLFNKDNDVTLAILSR
ncbi:hypothetical protein [Tissierella sp.]|jgi:uncharacterized membrane protein|uniref:hypothetical protein n=1 Tax=Tissierella sp. TaxID=41274 RepID=UPI003073069E